MSLCEHMIVAWTVPLLVNPTFAHSKAISHANFSIAPIFDCHSVSRFTNLSTHHGSSIHPSKSICVCICFSWRFFANAATDEKKKVSAFKGRSNVRRRRQGMLACIAFNHSTVAHPSISRWTVLDRTRSPTARAVRSSGLAPSAKMQFDPFEPLYLHLLEMQSYETLRNMS